MISVRETHGSFKVLFKAGQAKLLWVLEPNYGLILFRRFIIMGEIINMIE